MQESKKGRSYVFMGVSSSGKSTIGAMVAEKLGAKFIDGDDLHPRANIEKMKSGVPLDDDDREPWLQRINDVVFSLEQKNEIGVVVCSALRKKYRDLIRRGNQKLTFVYLQGDFELVLQRMQARKEHFMPVDLLKSQFDTLETPDQTETDVVVISIDGSMERVVHRCLTAIESPERGYKR
jgi:gluconokinase